ncbi:hypothetical protein [Reyranella sp.]|uniref:hypothetical protein n=1 Tax=Reyranella sp. TaxID=1929291 RepID=UPI003D101FB0
MPAVARRVAMLVSRSVGPPVRVAALVGVLALATPSLAQNRVPGERPLEALVKVSLLSFNDANVTGNFTVFHAKLSKPFRQQFTPERLQETFKSFAEQQIDFDIIAAYKPVYEPAALVNGDGRLIVKGYFPTEPTRVLFDLAFIPSDGEWKLISIHVKTEKAPQR